MSMVRKFCIFFSISFVVLVTLKVYNYHPKTMDLLADTTTDVPYVPLPEVFDVEQPHQTAAKDEDDGEFKEENPEATSKDEETLIEEE